MKISAPKMARWFRPTAGACAYGDLVAADMLHVQAQPKSKLKDPSTFKVMGQPMPRVDIPAKVTGGAAYVQDMRLPGMVHARVVRPPSYGAQLTDLDTSAVEKLPGVVKVVARRQFPRRRRHKAVPGDQGDGRVVSRREMAGDRDLAEAGRSAARADQPAVAGHDDFPTEQSLRRRPKNHRGHLYAAVSGARIDRAVLRRRAICRWRDDGLDSYARRLPRSPGHRGNAADAAGERALHPCRGLRMLRPQWRRRRGGGCGPDRARVARRAGPGAMDARAGARLGTVRTCDGDQAEGVAGWRGRDIGLEFRGLEQHPFDAPGRRGIDAGGAAHGAAIRSAGAETAAVAGRRRRPQRDPDLQISQREGGASLHPGDAAADFGDARARRLPQRVLHREFHGRTRWRSRRRSRRVQAETSRRSPRARRHQQGGARSSDGGRARKRRRIAVLGSPLRATRIWRRTAPSPPRWK